MRTIAFGFVMLILSACDLRSETPASIGATPVVLELFTSQGCSSCPPADALLSTLARDPELHDRLIPLAFHVDYWNHLGWSDPFSSPRWSQRQQQYAEALASGVYTPQAVIGGTTQAVGSEEATVRRLIANASRAPAPASISIESMHVANGHAAIHVRGNVRSAIRANELRLVIVLFENDVTTQVGAGENSGRTLHNDRIVRLLDDTTPIAAASGTAIDRTLDLAVDPHWRIANLGVAAFIQDLRTHVIYAAASR